MTRMRGFQVHGSYSDGEADQGARQFETIAYWPVVYIELLVSKQVEYWVIDWVPNNKLCWFGMKQSG